MGGMPYLQHCQWLWCKCSQGWFQAACVRSPSAGWEERHTLVGSPHDWPLLPGCHTVVNPLGLCWAPEGFGGGSASRGS